MAATRCVSGCIEIARFSTAKRSLTVASVRCFDVFFSGRELVGMRRVSYNKGFSLVEMLMAVAIVLVLLTLVIKVGGNLKEQAKCQLTGCTIEIIVDALTIYYDDHGQFPFEYYDEDDDGILDAVDFDGDGDVDLDDFLSPAIGDISQITYNSGANQPGYWSSQALYYHLANDHKTSRLIAALTTSVVTGKDRMGEPIVARIEKTDGSVIIVDLLRFVDPFVNLRSVDPFVNEPKAPYGEGLRYTYRVGDNFPVITSAGPDGDFSTYGDNVSSR